MSKTTKIGIICQEGPVPCARRVFWLIDGEWIHKGWLMPEIQPTEFRRGK